VAQRRTGIYQAPVLLTTTPYNVGWLKTEFYDRWKEGDSDYFVSQFARFMNPVDPQEEFERARRTMPPWRFKMFYEGRFERPEGLIFVQYEIVEPFEIPEEWPRYVGMDFGYNDPTVAIWAARGDDGTFYLYREYYERGKTIPEIARALHGLSKGEEIYRWIGDPSGAQYIAELNRLGIPIRGARRDGKEKEWKKTAIVKTDQMFRSGRAKVFRGLKHFLDEAEGWQWLMVDDQATDKPGDESHHALDAWIYMANELGDRVGISMGVKA